MTNVGSSQADETTLCLSKDIRRHTRHLYSHQPFYLLRHSICAVLHILWTKYNNYALLDELCKNDLLFCESSVLVLCVILRHTRIYTCTKGLTYWDIVFVQYCILSGLSINNYTPLDQLLKK